MPLLSAYRVVNISVALCHQNHHASESFSSSSSLVLSAGMFDKALLKGVTLENGSAGGGEIKVWTVLIKVCTFVLRKERHAPRFRCLRGRWMFITYMKADLQELG